MSGLIVHEWIEKTGGAEQVLERMLAEFPDSSVMCLWNDAPGRFTHQAVSESWLARTILRKHKVLALPFMPFIWRRIKMKGSRPDWILVSSHLFAHHARLIKCRVPKFVYVHTPARYIWEPDLDRRGANPILRMLFPVFKALDRRRAAEEGTKFAANSQFVRRRIHKTWQVSAHVIYPPVSVTKLQATSDWTKTLSYSDKAIYDSLPDEFLIGVSRFVPYKRLEDVLRAGAASKLPVIIAGSGPHEKNLRLAAEDLGVVAHFLIEPTNELLYAAIQKARALVFPAIEDFGIVPVEAMALGTPAIVNALGGASESVVDRVTGFHIDSFDDILSLKHVVEKSLHLNKADCLARAQAFSEEQFSMNLRHWIEGSEPQS